MLKVLN